MIHNSDVNQIPASAAVYRVSQIDEGTVFDYRSTDTALTYAGEGLLKRVFQMAHKGILPHDDFREFKNAYELDVLSFQATMRTVGVGTNILLREGSGTNGRLMMPMVGRTESGPDGTVALGKQSRAAGGAYGDLAQSGLRELNEEFICAPDTATGELVVYNIFYKEPALDSKAVQKLLAEKEKRDRRILQKYKLNANGIRFERVEGRVLSVPNLTQTITQVIDGQHSEIHNRVLTDNPAVGDFAGVDTIVLVDLPDGIGLEQVRVYDGEENFDGDLLRRSWSLNTPEEWNNQLNCGLKMSPAPQKVLDSWGKVSPVIRSI